MAYSGEVCKKRGPVEDTPFSTISGSMAGSVIPAHPNKGVSTSRILRCKKNVRIAPNRAARARIASVDAPGFQLTLSSGLGGPTHIVTRTGINPDDLSLTEEKGDLDNSTGGQGSGLATTLSGITF